MTPAMALETERRLHDGLLRALTSDPDMSEDEKAYHRAWSDMAWTYGENTPFEAAMQAYDQGDLETMKEALSDDRKLSELARMAYPQ